MIILNLFSQSSLQINEDYYQKQKRDTKTRMNNKIMSFYFLVYSQKKMYVSRDETYKYNILFLLYLRKYSFSLKKDKIDREGRNENENCRKYNTINIYFI